MWIVATINRKILFWNNLFKSLSERKHVKITEADIDRCSAKKVSLKIAILLLLYLLHLEES